MTKANDHSGQPSPDPDRRRKRPTGLKVSSELTGAVLSRLSEPQDSNISGTPYAEPFLAATLSQHPSAAWDYCVKLIDLGLSPSKILHNQIPIVAMQLGELWINDVLSFSEVSLGSARLQEASRKLVRAIPVPQADLGDIVLVPAPGETHTIGLVLAQGRLLEMGWNARLGMASTIQNLIAQCKANPGLVLGFSAGSRRVLPELRRVLARLKRTCPSNRMVVGGQLCRIEPNLMRLTGADFASASLRELTTYLETNREAADVLTS